MFLKIFLFKSYILFYNVGRAIDIKQIDITKFVVGNDLVFRVGHSFSLAMRTKIVKNVLWYLSYEIYPMVCVLWKMSHEICPITS